MAYMNKSIEEIHKALINKEVTVDELIKESLEKSLDSFFTISVEKRNKKKLYTEKRG